MRSTNPMNRRDFLYLAGVASLAAAAQVGEPGVPFRLGITTRVPKGQDPRATVARVRELGFSTCQIGFLEQPSPASVTSLKAALAEFQIEATAMLAAMPGP